MKGIITFVLLCLPWMLFSQLQLEEKGKGKTKTYLISKDYQNLIFITKEKNEMKLYHLNESYEADSITTFKVDNTLSTFEFIDLIETNNGYAILGKDYVKDEYMQIRKSGNKDLYVVQPIPVLEGTKLTEFVKDNVFHTVYISIDNKISIVSTDLSKVETKVYPVNPDNNLYWAFQEKKGVDKGMSIVGSMAQNSFSETVADAKIYSDENLYLTYDKKGGTVVVKIDLEADKKFEYTIPYDFDYKSSKSLLDSNILWQLGAEKNSMTITAKKIESGQLLFSHTFEDATSLHSINSQFFDDGSSSKNSEPKTFNNYEAFRKKVGRKELALAKSKMGDNYVLQIGHYDEVPSAGSYFGAFVSSMLTNGLISVYSTDNIVKEYYFMINLKETQDGTFKLDKNTTITDKNRIAEIGNDYLKSKLDERKKSIYGGIQNPYGENRMIIYTEDENRVVEFKELDEFSKP